MNNVQNNKMFAVRKPSHLICVWRATGGVGTPLVCSWVMANAAAIEMTAAEQKSEQAGALLCA
ncbi:hypothetical protein [Terriglobus roseus]|uniref:Uncharacterized protein n=1 Tax=Terriglobus roseus TaxID=392734 RepID=A0A1H4K9U2_9BACT|nr:hypothetical protein [Terriglobus roseus]SEB55300.1 hypothetical protein SAMN05443244_1089 [Terriglobus roseus]